MAFRLLASSSHFGSEKNDAVGAFLQQHILGFMARFGEVVNDVQNQYSVIEKIRCIKGVEEMVKIGKKVIKVARPQVGFQPVALPISELTFHQIGLCLFATSLSSTRASVCRLFCLGQNASQS
jgi:hypothetical protein